MVNPREDERIYLNILEAGAKLHLESGTSCAACLLAHKFFTSDAAQKAQVDSVCPWLVSGACLLLAAKSREDLIKLRDVTNVLFSIANPDKPPLEVDQNYWDMRESLGRMELVVLRALQFDVDSDTPHIYLLNFLDTLRQWLGPERFDESPTARVALALCRDAHAWPDLIVEEGAPVVAAACAHISLQCAGLRVPTDGPHWTHVLLRDSKSSSSRRSGGKRRDHFASVSQCARRILQHIDAHNERQKRLQPAEGR